MKKIIFSLIAIALLSSAAFANDTNIPNLYPSLGRSMRALGMGNAFLTMKGSDESAMFYNPAAIHDYSNEVMINTGIIPPSFAFNYGTINLIRDTFNFKDNLNQQTTDSGKIDSFNTFINKHIGEFHDLEVNAPLFGMYNRYFAVSIINDDRFGISFRNRAFPNFEIRATGLAGVQAGSAIGLFNDSLELGAAVKVLYGVERARVISTNDILINNFDDFKWSNWSRGLGVGGDVGAKYLVPDFGSDFLDSLKLTLAASYQNIGKTKFRWMKKNGGPDPLPQSVSAGIGVHPLLGPVETSIMVDIREINIKQDFLMRLNAGVEARFPERAGLRTALRAGCNQGYPTVGGSLGVWKFRWDVAYFGKELGQYTREKGGYRIASGFMWTF